MRGRVVMAAMALVLAWSPAAWSQSRQEKEARRLFLEGNRKVDSGNLDEAVSNYRAAFELAPGRPKILLNIGAVLGDLKRWAEQANTYQSYLDHPKRDTRKARKLKAALAKLDKRVGRLRLIIAPGGRVSIDGKPVAKGPLIKLHRVSVGSHAIIARFESGTVAKEVVAQGGSEETLELESPKAAPEDVKKDPDRDPDETNPDPETTESPSQAATSKPLYKRIWVYTLALGAGAAGAGVYFGLQAKSDLDAYNELLTTSPVEFAEADELEDSGKQKATYANVAFIAAGAFAITSGILMYLDFAGGDDGGEDDDESMAIMPLEGGGAMMVRGWRF